jgi:GNAT superfamily N-acetyltransferase
MLDIRELAASEATPFSRFTFPAYRHLLDLEPFSRLIEDPTAPESQHRKTPVAFGAFVSGEPAGLLLASVPESPSAEKSLDENAQLLSLFVGQAHRNKGLGGALVEAAEDRLRDSGHQHVHGVYITGGAAIGHLEKLFERRGWDPPSFRFATARFSYERLREAPWIRRVPSIRGYETLPWQQVKEEEKKAAYDRQQVAPWISESLLFWKYSQETVDPHTSLGIRYRDELVGWVLTHPYLDTPTLRFSCAFIHWDLAPLGMALPAVARSVSQMPRGGFTHGSFVTPEHLPGMQAAIAKYLKPWADFVGESRGVYKHLGSGQTAVSADP